MPQLNFSVPADLLNRIDASKPNFLDRKGFLCLLLTQALDASEGYGYDLGKGGRGVGAWSTSEPEIQRDLQNTPIQQPRSEAFLVSNETNKSSSLKNKGRNRKKNANYPDEFECFWRAYQQLPEKAAKQSKPLALIEWEAACEEVSPAQLLDAVHRQLAIQEAELAAERRFTVAMPDCFRWLRDGCYLALLEGHVVRQPELIIPGKTVL